MQFLHLIGPSTGKSCPFSLKFRPLTHSVERKQQWSQHLLWDLMCAHFKMPFRSRLAPLCCNLCGIRTIVLSLCRPGRVVLLSWEKQTFKSIKCPCLSLFWPKSYFKHGRLVPWPPSLFLWLVCGIHLTCQSQVHEMQHFSMMEKRREGGSQDDGNVVVVSETCSHLFFYKLFTTSDLTYRSFNVSYQELMSLVLFLITQANQSLFPKVKAATLCNPAENWALIYYFISILYTYFSKFPLSVLCLY